MAKEIERKFLVAGDSYKAHATERRELMQAYLRTGAEGATVRVRVTGERGFLTVKSPNRGIVRDEWEYEIPAGDAHAMASLAEGRPICKTRHIVTFGGMRWEVDEFHGDLQGLVLAEIELPSADTEVTLPPWVSREVTGDPRYYNSSLAAGQTPP